MAFLSIAIDGGLDLITAPQAVTPGRLTDCQNYEIARQRGIHRIAGYERFDGGVSPSFYRVYKITGDWASFDPPHGSNWSAGDTFVLGGGPVVDGRNQDGIISGFVKDDTAMTIQAWIIFDNDEVEPSALFDVGNTIVDVQTLVGFQILSKVGYTANFTETDTAIDNLTTAAAIFTSVSATIQPVPGQGNVNGVFWLKDKLYATRDYIAINFDTGTTEPFPGDVIFVGASFGAATWSAQVAKTVLTSGSWTDTAGSADTRTAAGVLMVYNATGTFAAADVIKNHTQADAVTVTVLGQNAASQGAGLYIATGQRGATVTTQSWQWCDLGFTIQYKDGVVDFQNMNRAENAASLAAQYVTTGWKTATTPSSGQASWNRVGSQAYPITLSTNDAANYVEWIYFTGGNSFPASGLLQLTGFGFTDADIPSTASITGIEVQIYRGAVGITAGHTASIVDKTLTLVGVAAYPVPINFADTVNAWTVVDGAGPGYPSYTFTLKDYGAPTTETAPTNLLGYAGITGADIKSANFGINYTVQLLGTQTAQQLHAGITQVRMRVSFLPETNKIYFWDGQFTSVADGAMTVNFPILVSATAAFTAASVGQTVTVAGAGPAGALLTATIVTYTNATTVVLSLAAGTTVAGAVTKFYRPVVAQVVQFYKKSGDIISSNAAGTVYLHFVQPNGTIGGPPLRHVGSDEAIRTYPASGQAPDDGVADGSTLLANSASGATMNMMDWSALLAGVQQTDGSLAPASKYQSITKNYYASSGYEAIYGVSGGGPAFYYDGLKINASGATVQGNFSRILTGLSANLETPRSATAHQGHLMLGYLAGIVQQSDSLNVLDFDQTIGTDAAEYGFSERVTGINSINGDALGVWTQSTVQMIQGQVNSGNAYESIIAPTSGGLEYSIQPMANYMYADFRGITMIGATQKYGDFEAGHISAEVAPFLIPRLQLSAFFESSNIGFINSVLIRNKNMARYFFADGKAMSLTFLADGENPQFAIQQYYHSDGVTPMTWDVVQAFTESTGRDRIFGATADGTGYVYELERGITFDGAVIPAYAVLVPDAGQAAYQNKTYSGINVFGQAQDYATFQLSRGVNYTSVAQATGGNVISERFGLSTAVPTGNIQPFVSYGTSGLQIEGTAIGLRFDSGTNGYPSASLPQFSHTIQALSYDVKPSNTQNQ